MLTSLKNQSAIVLQRFIYGTAPPVIPPDEEDILEQALRLEEEEQEHEHEHAAEHDRMLRG